MKGMEKAVAAREVYAAPERTGGKVCIINGGLAGAELGIFLAGLGRTVTVVGEAAGLGGGDLRYIKDLQYRMVSAGIDARCHAKVFEITDSGVECEGGFIEADTVVYDTDKT